MSALLRPAAALILPTGVLQDASFFPREAAFAFPVDLLQDTVDVFVGHPRFGAALGLEDLQRRPRTGLPLAMDGGGEPQELTYVDIDTFLAAF